MNAVADAHQRQGRIPILLVDDLHGLFTQDLAALFLARIDQFPYFQAKCRETIPGFPYRTFQHGKTLEQGGIFCHRIGNADQRRGHPEDQEFAFQGSILLHLQFAEYILQIVFQFLSGTTTDQILHLSNTFRRQLHVHGVIPLFIGNIMDAALSRSAISQCTHSSSVGLVAFSQMFSDTADTDMTMHFQNAFRTLYHLSHGNMQIPVEGRRGGRQHCNDPAVHGKRIMLHIFLQYHIHGMYQFRSRTVLPVGILHRDGQHRILKGIITILQKAVANRLFL